MLREIPFDMVKKILLLLDPEDLQSECRSNKYVTNICRDDTFFQEYIKRNFDPIKFGYQQWNSSIFEDPFINQHKNINRNLPINKRINE